MNTPRYRLVPENEQTQEQPEPSEPKYRFRWAVFVGAPLAIAAVLFLLNGINPSFEIEDLLDWLGVVMNQNRYVRMMCLMVVCIAVLLIVKLFKNKSE